MDNQELSQLEAAFMLCFVFALTLLGMGILFLWFGLADLWDCLKKKLQLFRCKTQRKD